MGGGGEDSEHQGSRKRSSSPALRMMADIAEDRETLVGAVGNGSVSKHVCY